MKSDRKSISLIAIAGVFALLNTPVSAQAPTEDQGPQQAEFLFLMEDAYLEEHDEWEAALTVDHRLRPSKTIYTVELGYGVSDDLQIEIEVPFEDRNRSSGFGDAEVGLDVALLQTDDGQPFQLTAGAAVVIPTGDKNDGIGTGDWGYELSLRAATHITPSVQVNLAAGHEALPNGGTAADAVKEWSAGVGLTWSVDDDAQIVSEFLHEREREEASDETEHEVENYLSTGVIVEVVDGVSFGSATAFGLSHDSDDIRILTKLQFEL